MKKSAQRTLLYSDVRGPMQDLCIKLDGPDCFRWLRAFQRFLRKEDPWAPPSGEEVSISLGLHSSSEEYFQAIESRTLERFSGFSNGMFSEFPESTSEKIPMIPERSGIMKIFVTTPEELGFGFETSWTNVLAAAAFYGLKLCPMEAAIIFCLEYHINIGSKDGFVSIPILKPESTLADRYVTLFSNGSRKGINLLRMKDGEGEDPSTFSCVVPYQKIVFCK